MKMLDSLTFHLDHLSAGLRCGEGVPKGGAWESITNHSSSRGLSRARLLENMLMVSVGIRRSSMFHPAAEIEVVQVHEIVKELELGMAVRKAGSMVHKVFIFGPEREDLAGRIPDLLEDMGGRKFIIGQITIANLTGDFLDFPECCVRSFVKHLMDGTDQDKEALELLRGHPEASPDAYFVERFIPCRPDCPEALGIGRRLEKQLHDLDPALARSYSELKKEHMGEIGSGSLLLEKMRRDRLLEKK